MSFRDLISSRLLINTCEINEQIVSKFVKLITAVLLYLELILVLREIISFALLYTRSWFTSDERR